MTKMRLSYAETRGPEALRFRRYQHHRHGVIETLTDANVVHVKGSLLLQPLPVEAIANKPRRKRSKRRLKVMPAPAQVSLSIHPSPATAPLRRSRGGG